MAYMHVESKHLVSLSSYNRIPFNPQKAPDNLLQDYCNNTFGRVFNCIVIAEHIILL